MTDAQRYFLILVLRETMRETLEHAGAESFGDIEQYAVALDAAAQADISAVTPEEIYALYVMLQSVKFSPSVSNLARYWRELASTISLVQVGPQSVYVRGVDGLLEYSLDGETWQHVFPPDAHEHLVEDISDFPATLPPTAHEHLVEDISDFPATMPPTAHEHLVADISDFPALPFTTVQTTIGAGNPWALSWFPGRTIAALYGWCIESPVYPDRLGECVQGIPGGHVRRETYLNTVNITTDGSQININGGTVTFNNPLFYGAGQKWTWIVWYD